MSYFNTFLGFQNAKIDIRPFKYFKDILISTLLIQTPRHQTYCPAKPKVFGKYYYKSLSYKCTNTIIQTGHTGTEKPRILTVTTLSSHSIGVATEKNSHSSTKLSLYFPFWSLRNSMPCGRPAAEKQCRCYRFGRP